MTLVLLLLTALKTVHVTS